MMTPLDAAVWTAEAQTIFWAGRLCSDEYIAKKWNELSKEERLAFIKRHKHQIRGAVMPDKKD